MLKEAFSFAAYDIIQAISKKIEPLYYSTAEKEYAAEFKKMHLDELRNIGKSFRENLLPGLPNELSDFSKILSLHAQDIYKRDLRNRLDVRNAGYAGFILSEHGLTPVDIARISHASGRDLRLRMHAQNLHDDKAINFIENNFKDREDASIITRQDLLVSVWEATDVPRMTAVQLTDWFIKILPYKPYAVSGFKFEAGEKNPYFTQLPRSKGEDLPGLDFVWSSPKQK